MRERIIAHRKCDSEMSILSPLRVSAFLHSQDPKRRFVTIICRIAIGSSDHLVGAREQRRRDSQTKGFSGLEIYYHSRI
jgi:hypothetical protein